MSTKTTKAKSKPKTTKANAAASKETAPEHKQHGPANDGAGTSGLSALDAAAKVLAEAGKPMNCQEMIGVMAGKGYWVSPNGKTPAATLYSAILREITRQGERSRFLKVGR